MQTFKELIVWQKSMQLVIKIYDLTKKLPAQETYGLSMQMRRAAVSIPSNVAEGFRRFHNKEYRQFLRISLSSCAELETQILIAESVNYISTEDISESLRLLDHIGRMLTKLIKSI